MMLVPTIDQIKVIATAANAPRSDESKSVLIKPRPIPFSKLFNNPSWAKKRSETMPITTQEIAVGKKYTERKKRHPNTCSFNKKAIPIGITIAIGTEKSSKALFCITRQKIGLENSLM